MNQKNYIEEIELKFAHVNLLPDIHSLCQYTPL